MVRCSLIGGFQATVDRTSEQRDEKRRLLSQTVTQRGVFKRQLPQHAHAGLQQAIHALRNDTKPECYTFYCQNIPAD